ncbi:MAG: hypothetical protein JW895_16195 [Thermoleophilaceae bacterium]|nr:hypothetical protein [Thermoleophilaceae bacterium]
MSLLVLAGLLAAAVVPATGAEGDELLPDLVAQPVGEQDTTATATYTDSSGSHLLMRFSSYIANVGAGPLEVTGINPSNERISGAGLHQVITHEGPVGGANTTTEELVPGAEMKFEETDGHDHWHFQNAARYSLYSGTQSAPSTQEVGFSNKVGFCFLDIGHGDPNYVAGVDHPNHFKYAGLVAPRTFFHDAVTHPAEPCLTEKDGTAAHPWDVTDKVDMGISAGWRDVYEYTLPFQYVDVSDVTPGWYWIKSEVDPDNLLREAAGKETNAAAFSTKPSVVPGYIAKPVNAGQISGVKPTTSKITLSSTKFANPADPAIGAVQYKITEQPEHGTLKPITGSADSNGWFSAADVIYTKNGSYNGSDTFKYAARQAGSQFPLNPTSASVTMQVGNGTGDTTVGINGSPAWVYTGAAVQLSASVVPSGDVTWRVADTIGGHPGVGTISTAGLYRAPATVPDGGKVRITATSDDGAFDAVEITIVKRPTPTPKPDVPDPVIPKPPSKPTTPVKPAPALSKPVIARVGRRLVVKYMPGKTGKLGITVKRNGKTIATCKVGVVRSRSATCRFALKKSRVKKLTGRIGVYAKLTVKGKTVATRRTTVSLKVKASSTRIGPLCILTPLK